MQTSFPLLHFGKIDIDNSIKFSNDCNFTRFSIKTFYRSRKKDLDEEDLPECLDEHRSDLLGQKIAVNWSKEYEKALKKKKKPSLTKVIIKTFHCDFFIYGLIIFIMEMCVRYKYCNSSNIMCRMIIHKPKFLD